MYRATPIELGPDSLLWRWAGDQRLGFTGLSAGLLQLMHPGLGAGVVEHSAFFTEPWDRIFRSIPEIIGVVYDGPAAEDTGHRVRDYHRRIKGVDAQGRAYSALKPETFWWAHATFQFAVEQVADRFDSRNLSDQRREQLYREGIEWYRRYGVSLRPVPATRAEFQTRWDHYCADILEMTPAADRAVDMALNGRVEDMPNLPTWTQPIQRYLLTPLFRLTSIGGLPSSVRQRFGIEWGGLEAAELKAMELWVRETWRFVPGPLRWAPRAAEGRRRAAQDQRHLEAHAS